MSDESLVPIPPKEVPERIEGAFEIEKPNASITIVVNPPTASIPFEEMQDLMVSRLGYEDKEREEDLKRKKQERLTDKKIGDTRVGMSQDLFWLAVAWTTFVAFCVFCCGFGWMILSDKVLFALIGSAALPPIINSLIKLFSKPKEN